MENKQGNILGTQPIGQLLLKFAVPSIIAMQVSALYNIVDQIFIGHSVGVLGNAATNVAFPLSTVCVALCLLFGVGGAANFNLCMGAGDKERARHFVGNAVALLLLSGILLSLFSFILLEPMMRFFGATPDVLGYALEYTGITLWGFPFLIIANGGANLVRADGSPKYSMMCMLVGAIINTVLDAQPDAVGRFQHKFTQELRQWPGLDLLHGDCPLLGASHRLFGDKQGIALLHFRGGVFHHHIGNVVRIGDNMSLDAQAAVPLPLHLYHLIFSRIDYHLLPFLSFCVRCFWVRQTRFLCALL